jgi:hypothetical protein
MDHMEAFERLARLKHPRVLAIGLLVGLSSCTVVTDRMRFHFDDERRGSFSASAFVPIMKTRGESDIMRTEKIPLEQSIEKKVKDCGLPARTFRRDGKVHVDINTSFASPDQLEKSLACLPGMGDGARIESRRDEGWFRSTYVTTIRLEGPRTKVDFGEQGKRATVYGIGPFPRELALTVPGTIGEIHSDTDILGADLKAEQSGTSEARAILTERADAEALREGLRKKVQADVDAGKVDAANVSRLPPSVYAVTVTSHQWRFGLQEILSVLGALFGSGFLLQFLRSRLPAGKRRRQAARGANRSS